MADERGATLVGGVEAEVRALRQDVTELKVDVAEVKGELRQIDKRLSNVETTVSDLRRDIRQVLFFVVGAILVPILIEIAKRAIH